jgi:mRNA interferase RelE/StbE
VTYTVRIKQQAEKQIRSFPNKDIARIHNKILELAEQPRPKGVKKLAEGVGWRVRVGTYRIIYEIDDASREIIIIRVKLRKDVYR